LDYGTVVRYASGVLRRCAPLLGFAAGLGLGWGSAGCIGEIRVCEIDPADNVCGGDGDCVLAYCATDCCPCPNAYSASQVGRTYCLTRQGETPLTECLTGRQSRCGESPFCGPCVYDIEPWCNGGRCDIRSTR
jgi:hypothetical protein